MNRDVLYYYYCICIDDCSYTPPNDVSFVFLHIINMLHLPISSFGTSRQQLLINSTIPSEIIESFYN